MKDGEAHHVRRLRGRGVGCDWRLHGSRDPRLEEVVCQRDIGGNAPCLFWYNLKGTKLVLEYIQEQLVAMFPHPSANLRKQLILFPTFD